MREIRKADFFYPGFEHAGVETAFERGMTRFFCAIASLGASLFDALSAPHPSEAQDEADRF